MKATTSDNRRLKRLATQYAEAYHQAWTAVYSKKRVKVTREVCKKARKKLFDAIDALTTHDLTPRAVDDSL